MDFDGIEKDVEFYWTCHRCGHRNLDVIDAELGPFMGTSYEFCNAFYDWEDVGAITYKEA